ncbi:MAG: O-antigen ligase family protein [bacterium]
MAKDISTHKKTELTDSFPSIWLDKLVFWLLLVTVVALPLYFNIMSFDQFELPKLTLLRIITTIMTALWLVRMLEKGKFEFIQTPLDLPLLGFAIMNLVTTFTSFAPQLSFRGEYENFAGSLSTLNYILIYFIAVNHINTLPRIKAFNYAILISGAIITIYAISQFFGYDIVQWSEDSLIKGRYFASMGNPNFLGALLAMIIPINLALLLINIRNKKYIVSASLLLLCILMYIALFGTQSRAPFLAFVASLFVFGIYWLSTLMKNATAQPVLASKHTFAFLSNELPKHRKVLAFVLGLIIVTSTLSITIGREATNRLWNSIANVKQSLAVSRLHIWIPALKIINENPILGTGVDTFKSVFPKYAGTNFAQIDGANVSSRTAHNELLNIAATMGITTLGIYLLLILSYILMWYRAFKRISDNNIRLISIAMFASFIAYFVQNLFSFGVAAINTYLYMIFAAHAIIYCSLFGSKIYLINLFEPANNKSKFIKYSLQIVVILLAAFFSYEAYMIYSADVHYNKAKNFGLRNKWDIAVEEHIKAVNEAPHEVKYYVYLALAYEKLAMITQDRNQQLMLIHKAAESYTVGVKINPGNSYYWGNLGRIYALLARYEDIKYLQTSIDDYKMAIKEAPVTGLFYGNLIDLYLNINMPDNALPYIQKLELYDTKLASNAYFLLGNYYFGKKHLAEAIAAYHKSIDLNPDFSMGYYNLGVACAASGSKKEAIVYLRKYIELSPTSDMVANAKKILKDYGLK